MIPRIRGSAVQKDNGKWTFFLLVGMMGAEECDEYNFDFDFETKEEAIAELKRAAQVACEAVEIGIDGEPSGKYIDLKTNSTLKWDKTDQH